LAQEAEGASDLIFST